MFNLDPGKLIVIAVVAIILLGPDKLPQVARQVGGAWRSFTDFRHRMEAEVRSSIPDLPATSEIARLARSPSALLHHLSTMSDEEKAKEEQEGPDAPEASDRHESDNADAAAAGTPGERKGDAVALSNGAGGNGARPDPDHHEPAVAPPDPDVAAFPAPAPSSSSGAVVQGDPNLN